MAKIEMTEEERQTFLELNTFLTRIVIQDPDVEPDVAKSIAEKAKLMQGCMTFPEEIKKKYGKIADIFSKLSGI